MSTYFVSDHVSVCVTPDAAILLDLRANKYHGLSCQQASALAFLVHGWPCDTRDECKDEREGIEFADQLVHLGLLTKDDVHGKSAAPPPLPRVQLRLHEWNGERWPAIRAAHWLRFAMAVARAKFSLRLCSMESTVRRVQRRKAATASGPTHDLAKLYEVTAVYRALRPFFYTQKNYCLLDSLVLIEFMALHDLFPTWVIGVTPMPFGAHSWVQVDHYVLTCTVQSAREYMPILAV